MHNFLHNKVLAFKVHLLASLLVCPRLQDLVLKAHHRLASLVVQTMASALRQVLVHLA